MVILVVNCGSSSLKYTLFKGEEELGSGLVEKIGETVSVFSRSVRGQKITPPLSLRVDNHEQSIHLMMEWLVKDGLIRSESEIQAVGHRVVHGGPDYKDAALVDEKVRNNRIAIDLAPLHKPNYEGIEAMVKILPATPQVAVFDTAFHQTMPPKAYVYALPYRYYSDMKIRKYGAHGTSHKYVSHRCAQLLEKPAAETSVITLHLGNGSSLAAVERGICVDTSMGLTPLAGVVMGSRCGDIDPAIVPFIMEKDGMNPKRVDKLMNKESGLLGLSGISNDLREVIAQAEQGNERAQLALDVFVYSIQKYIGSYYAVLEKTDALVFTAGIGEKSPLIRQRICQGLKSLGVRLDPAKNQEAISREMFIHHPDSKVKVVVIPTREEHMIAEETERVVAACGHK